jgi:hypothetical protein
MNKSLLFFLLSSTILFSQNKELITKTLNKQTINNIDKIASENGYERKESVFINAFFKCDSNGEIFDITIAKESKIFEDEIKEFIYKIPKLNPNEYIRKGNIMKYGLKMRFKLASKKEHKKIINNGEKINIKYQWLYIKEYFPVKTIEVTEIDKNIISKNEKFPLTKNCKNLTDINEIKNCVSRELAMHVNKNFDTDLAADLTTKRHRVDITFYISKNGEIVNITADAETPELIEEGIRVINTFPDFYQGGKKNGEPVDVKFTFPLIFSIH